MHAVTLPPLTLANSVPKDADVLVVGLADASGTETLIGLPTDLEKRYAKQHGITVLAMAQRLGAKAKPGTTVTMPLHEGRQLVVVGLGPVDVTPEQVRRAAGNGVRAAAQLGEQNAVKVVLSFEALEPDVLKGVAEGALLGSYTIPKITRTAPKPAIASITVLSTSTKPAAAQAVATATTIAQAVCTARQWVNTPANLIYPQSLAEEARALAKGTPITVEVWDDRALEKDGFGGILAVGSGSARKPRLVRYSYSPRGATFHLVLVGKGVTFDTGGLNLKPLASMLTMKCDMAGAAAVLNATRAIADLGLAIKVTAYAPLAENMPSGEAFRPSDVITMYGGTTVENTNSDAEGRLILADSIARAAEDSPHMIVDIATLTGASIIALGERTAGLMATDDATADRVLDAAETAGEPLWHLPIPEEMRGKLDSRTADLKSTASRHGGALVAAAFLRTFVPDAIPWAHLDIAGPAFNEETPFDYVTSGGTGFGVRTLVALAQALQGESR